MKHAFIYPGGPATPDRPKAVSWGITRLFWEARDPQATTQLLKDERKAGMAVGLMRDPTWTPGLSARGFAEKLSQDLTDHGFGTSTGPDSCAVMADAEVHGNQFALDWLTRFRELRPTRTLIWTMEPFQGGWIEPSLAGFINRDPYLTLCVQLYLGSPRMYPADAHKAVEDLKSRGINPDKITSFYDGEHQIPYGWNGIVYDFIKLPASPPIAL